MGKEGKIAYPFHYVNYESEDKYRRGLEQGKKSLWDQLMPKEQKMIAKRVEKSKQPLSRMKRISRAIDRWLVEGVPRSGG